MGLWKLLRKLTSSQRGDRFDYKSFWIKDGMRNIVTKKRYGEFPEGFDVVLFLKELLARYEFDSALDFGCGYGRLSPAFDKDKYIGVDLNPEALEKARADNPGYRYQEVSVESEDFPKADLCLAYTVFLHLDDSTLDSLLGRLSGSMRKYLIIAEILGREWRRDGLPPVFNREREEYLDIMSRHGFDYLAGEDRPYARYIDKPSFRDKKNKNISYLIFARR